MEEILTSSGSGSVRRGDRLLGLQPTPGQCRIIQLPQPTPHGHGRRLDSSCGQPQEGVEELGTNVLDPGMGGHRCKDVWQVLQICNPSYPPV